MSNSRGSVTYLYWSERNTTAFLEDRGIDLATVTTTTTSPNASWLPTFSKSVERDRMLRPIIANTIEAALGVSLITEFNAPAPIRFAKGIGSVVFGEFKTWMVDTKGQAPAVIFTTGDHDVDDKGSVAICLFGGMQNFAGRIQDVGPGFVDGWFSSSAPWLFDFLQTLHVGSDSPYTKDELAIEALTIATDQGSSHLYTHHEGSDPTGFDRPWFRAFTYGDLQDAAEWLARIDIDVDLLARNDGAGNRIDGFRRILVGAPFWIRTTEPWALRLYGEHQPNQFSRNRRFFWRRTPRPRRGD